MYYVTYLDNTSRWSNLGWASFYEAIGVVRPPPALGRDPSVGIQASYFPV